MQHSDRFLKFGDLILLYSDFHAGYLMSQGCFVQKCRENREAEQNFRDFVFEVQPRQSYEALKDLQNQKRSIEKKKKERKNQLANEGKTSTFHIQEKKHIKIHDNFHRLQILRMRTQQETELNKRTISMKKTQIITYGSQVQLVHVDSQGILAIGNQAAIEDKSCNSIKLVQNGIENNIYFKVQPRYKYRQQGEKIVYNDHVLLTVATQQDFVLHVADSDIKSAEINLPTQNYRNKDPQLRAWLNSSMKLSKWQIIPHFHSEAGEQVNKFIHGGDIIRLRHTQMGGNLISDSQTALEDTTQVKCRVYKKETEFESELSINSFFQVQIATQNERGQFAMWHKRQYRLRHLNTGRLLTVLKKPQIAREKGPEKSGYYLALIVCPTIQEEQQQYLENTTFSMQSTALDQDNRIRFNSCVKLKHIKTKQYICSNKQEGLQTLNKKNSAIGNALSSNLSGGRNSKLLDKKDSINQQAKELGIQVEDQFSQVYTEMKDQQVAYVQHSLKLMGKPREEDAFTLIKGDEEEIRDVMYLHTCAGPLKQFLSDITLNHQDISEEYYNKMIELLSKMIFFITDTEDDDPFTCQGIQRRHRQQCMREVNIIELLCDILYYPFQKDRIKLNEMADNMGMTRVCQLVYRLLKHTAKGYVKNILYEAQWIDLFFKEAMMTSEDSDLMAEDTITELLSTNQDLLDKQIKRKTIQDFIALCRKQRKNKRFMAMLTALCSVNGEAVASKQNDICQILFDGDKDNLMMPLRVNSRMVEVLVRDGGELFSMEEQGVLIPLPQFQFESQQRDGGRLYDYFVYSLDLVAELCLDRNYKGINQLDPIFQSQVVYSCMADQSFGERLRAGFAKVFLYLHIDKSPLEPLQLPRKVRVWTDIPEDPNDIQFPCNRITDAYHKLAKTFVTQYLIDLQGVQTAYNQDTNYLTLQILYLAQAMVRFGFYQTQKQLSEMVDPLITLLDGTLDITNQQEKVRISQANKEVEKLKQLSQQKNKKKILRILNGMRIKSRYMVNEKTLLLMKCKQKICDVLELVMNLQQEIRISKYLVYFKLCEIQLNQSGSSAQRSDAGRMSILSSSQMKSLAMGSKRGKKFIKRSTPVRWIDKVLEDISLDLEQISQRDFVAIMLDILLYEKGSLKSRAFSILMRFFTQRKTLISLLDEIQILESPSSIETYRHVTRILLDLKQMCEKAQYWMGQTDRNSVLNAKKTIKSLDFLSSLCVKKKKNKGQNQKEQQLKIGAEPEVQDTIQDQMGLKKKSPSPSTSLLGVQSQSRSQQKNPLKRVDMSSQKYQNFAQELKQFDPNQIPVTSEAGSPHQDNQKLLNYLGAHQVALILIKHKGLNIADDQQAYLTVLKKAYQFMILFVRDFPQNQEVLMDQLEPIQDDFSHGVNAVELLVQVFRNNPRMGQVNTKTTLKTLISTIINQATPFHKKTIFMNYLPVFMEMKGGRLFKNNQIDTLTQLTHRKANAKMYNGKAQTSQNDDSIQTLQNFIQNLNDQRLKVLDSGEQVKKDDKKLKIGLSPISEQNGKKAQIVMKAQLGYYIEFLNVLATSAVGKNSVTQVHCQQLLSLQMLYRQLQIADICYPLKSVLMKYFLHVYLDIQKNMGDENLDLIRKISMIILDDLKLFYEFKTDPQSRPQYKTIRMKNALGSRSMKRFFTVYIYEQVLPVVHDIVKGRINVNFQDLDIKSQLIQYARHLPQLTRNNEYIRIFNTQYKAILAFGDGLVSEEGKTPRNFGDESALLDDQLLPSYSQDQDSLLSHSFSRNNNYSSNTLSQNLMRQSLDYNNNNLIEQEEQQDEHLPSEKLKQKIQDKKKGKFVGVMVTSQEIQFAPKHKILLQQLNENVENNQKVQQEFQDLINSIADIKKKSLIGFQGKCTISPQEIIQSLIKLTSSNNDQLSQGFISALSQIEFAILILRRLIERENIQMSTPAIEWETNDWIKFQTQIIEKQNLMGTLGAVSLICRLISLGGSVIVKKHSLQLANTLLLGGNNFIQHKFLQYMHKDNSNEFVISMKQLISSTFSTLKTIQSERNRRKLKVLQLDKQIQKKLNIDTTRLQMKKKMFESNTIQDIELSCQQEDQLFHLHPSLSSTQNFDLSREIFLYSLRFLQLLCENHNIYLQNHLRVQKTEEEVIMTKSFDFVSSISIILSPLHKVFNQNLIQISMQIVETLTDFIQGPCRGNQKALISTKIIDNSRDFIRDFQDTGSLDFDSRDLKNEQEAVDLLKMKFVRLLLSLLEGEVDTQIIQGMASSLDYKLIRERITQSYQNFLYKSIKNFSGDITQVSQSQVKSSLRYDSFQGAINQGFDLFILLNTLRDNTKNKQARRNMQLSNYDTEQKIAYQFFDQHSARIQIINNGIIQRIYFPISPICKFLSKQSRKHLMENVDRDSANEKINGLMLAAPDLQDEMHHNEELSRRKCKITSTTANQIRNISFYIDIIINILMIGFFYRDFDNYLIKNIASWVQETIKYLGYVSVVLSSIVLISWCLAWASLKIQAKWREYAHANKDLVHLSDDDRKLQPSQMSIHTTRMLLHGKGPDCDQLNLHNRRNLGNFPTRLQYVMISFIFLLENNMFRYFLFYLAVAIAGVVSNPLFFSLHLFDVVQRNPTLLNVIQAVTRNKDQLLMTAMLMTIVLYIYAAFAFFYLQDTLFETNINKYENTSGENTCQTLLHCFINVIYFGLRMGGGLGDITKQVKYQETSRFVAKFIFDFTFFLIVIIIMLNILFGIIIDTFAQLRDARSMIQDDMNNKCFICNIDRYTFDRYGGGFQQHIESDHSLWHYLFYIAHIKTKDPTDYSGVESYVAQKYGNDDISWIPLHRAMCLDGKIQEQETFEELVKSKVSDLENQFKNIQELMEQ